MEQRQHTEDIMSGSHEYRIEMGGTMDGENTRSPVGYQVYDQAFEPNRFVRIENVGDTPLRNAWLIANGRDWRTIRTIVDGVITPDMDEAERALALWNFQRRCRFHATPGDRDNQDPVKMLNIYGYTLCGDDCHVLADLWRAAGLNRIRAGHPSGHSTSEVFYDGMWHLLDGDEHAIYLMRDNRTIAGEVDIVRDHDLVKRTHVYGILSEENRKTNESAAASFYFEDERGQERESHTGHRMGLDLRPGEALEWRWEGRGKFHGRRNIGQWRNAWSRIYNGNLIYTPDLKSDLWRYGVAQTQNVPETGALRPAGADETAAVFEVKSPYAITGGRIRLRGSRRRLSERVAVSFSFDGETWTEIWMAGELGETETEVSLDRYFGELYFGWDRAARRTVPTEGPARYGYSIRVCFQGEGARIEALTLESDLQMAPLSLPGVHLGENRMHYVDETEGTRRVRITHAWRESSDSRPPRAPARPVFPEDGAKVAGTKFGFEWTPAEDPDGREIADYQLELSSREDMKYALSPNFEKLISRTARKTRPRYEIPFEGLLNPGQAYFWRVRARNEAGVWGPWSRVWSFTPRAPGVPLDLHIQTDRKVRAINLHWRPNPAGRTPVRYEIYGSDEKGFTASDVPYPVLASDGETATFPPNLVATIEKNASCVLGESAPEKTHAYYRVIAVDADGVRSGASDYADTPRPFIFSCPVKNAKIGQKYRYAVQVTRSIGDLRRIRSHDARYWRPAFENADALRFFLEGAPAWLSIDKEGIISGHPASPGEFRMRVRVVREQGGEDVQSYTLKIES